VAQLEIRLARPADLEPAVALWERSRREAQPWLEERMGHSHEDNLRHFRDVVMRRNEVWLAVEGTEIVGLLALDRGHIDQLHVEPSRQGRGIGTALLDHAKERAPGGLTLFTHQRNLRARTFYERRGLRAVRLGVSPPPESEPDVEYRWEPVPG
jgi:ribosomal protein S18 acetylase RimI-like enzyme